MGSKRCEGYGPLEPLGQRLGRVEKVFCNGAGDPQYVGIRTGLFGQWPFLSPVVDVVVDHERKCPTPR